MDALSQVDRSPARGASRFASDSDGATPLSLQATATKMDIGVRRVRRAEEEALEILRHDATVLAAHVERLELDVSSPSRAARSSGSGAPAVTDSPRARVRERQRASSATRTAPRAGGGRGGGRNADR